MAQKQQVMKIQTKITKLIERNSVYRGRKEEASQLVKELKSRYDGTLGVIEVSETINKPYINKQNEVVEQRVVVKKQYKDADAEALNLSLRSLRKSILRFDKRSTLYVNHLCERIVEEFIRSCKPSVDRKGQEKTFGWKQFSNDLLQQSFVGALVQGSGYYGYLLDLKRSAKKLDFDRKIQHLMDAQRLSNAGQRTNVTEKQLDKVSSTDDLKQYKQLVDNALKELVSKDSSMQELHERLTKMAETAIEQVRPVEKEKKETSEQIRQLEQQLKQLKPEENKAEYDDLVSQLSALREKREQLKSKIAEYTERNESARKEQSTQLATLYQDARKLSDAEFVKLHGEVYASEIAKIYDGIRQIQEPDDSSKMLFNMVKNTTKKLQKEFNSSTETAEKKSKLKIANGYKNLISKIINQFLVTLGRKIEIYLQGTATRTLRLEDISKIVRIWVTHEEVSSVELQIQNFEQEVMQETLLLDKQKKQKVSVPQQLDSVVETQ